MALNTIIPQGFHPERDRQASVRAYIDSTLTDLFNQLSLPPAQAQPSITLRCRASRTSCVFNRVTGALETRQDANTSRTYSWPGDTAYESWKFSMRLPAISVQFGLVMPRAKKQFSCSCDYPSVGDH